MKVLTLWQPWASLVQLGVKTIETRSWSTTYRGPLAIHAAARPVGRCTRCNGGGMVAPGSSCPECGGDGRHELMGAYWDHAVDDPPLGAIVATCTLVDVVPICAIEEDELPPCVAVGPTDLTLWEVPDYWHNESDEVDITCQRPYGLFEPGRYAWLLADVVPMDPPVPFKGAQGLTKTWEPIKTEVSA
jgi:hypothetical protein